MKALLLSLGLGLVATMAAVSCSRAPRVEGGGESGPRPCEPMIRSYRPNSDEFAVSYCCYRRGLFEKTFHQEYEIALEGSRDRAARKRGATIWASREIMPGALKWVTRDSLNVSCRDLRAHQTGLPHFRRYRREGVVVGGQIDQNEL